MFLHFAEFYKVYKDKTNFVVCFLRLDSVKQPCSTLKCQTFHGGILNKDSAKQTHCWRKSLLLLFKATIQTIPHSKCNLIFEALSPVRECGLIYAHIWPTWPLFKYLQHIFSITVASAWLEATTWNIHDNWKTRGWRIEENGESLHSLFFWMWQRKMTSPFLILSTKLWLVRRVFHWEINTI